MQAFNPCTKEKNFGYEEGRPCIFLKLNKIYNWIPEYYNTSSDIQSSMPDRLKTHISNRAKLRLDTNVVWVSCEGENPADIENLGNGISYYSLNGEQGFLGYYFPFMSTKGYLQPLVAVQFNTAKRE
jgi:sodium/potassium-transporting ATPase subunit beta